MNKIPVTYLNFNEGSPDKGYWDMHLLSKIFQKQEFEIVENATEPERADHFAIIVVPARHNYNFVKEINEYINWYSGVVLIIAGDEEALFPVEQIKHPNMKLWMMTPHAGNSYPNVDRFIGEGYTPHCDLVEDVPQKDLRWFFAGQITHKNRVRCAMRLRKLQGGELVETEGFTKGLPHEEYIKKLSRTKVIPCPSGPVTPDTFRLYETLELGGIPLADAYASNNYNEGYWQMLFGDNIPFPLVKNWNSVEDLINFYNDTFEENSIKVFAWWQRYKIDLYYSLLSDFAKVSGMNVEEKITVIVPTSPVPSNPDTSFLKETLNSIRAHLPTCKIILTFDGVREEQIEIKPKYLEFIKNSLWMINKEFENIYPIVFDSHTHQVGMCREALNYVGTKTILYVEHDTPLTPDMPIEWEGIYNMIDKKDADLVRFHFEAYIPEEHKYLMLDSNPQIIQGVSAIRTIQWSQRPHLADAEWYRRILGLYFSQDAKTFIEDKMHGVVLEAYKKEQLQGWNKFKLWIYHPDGQIKRSYHTDARESSEKFDDKLIF